MKQSTNKILLTLASFALYFYVQKSFFGEVRTWIDGFIHQIGLSHILTYIVVGLPILLGTLLIHKDYDVLDKWGLNRSVLKAFLFAAVCTLPMFVGYAVVFEYNTEFSLNRLLVVVVAAAFFEELYYRGFLFGQLFRYTNWGFIPSVLIGSLIFGAVHLYQGTAMSDLIGIFLVTFSGGVLFAWVYAEWNYNLWVPIFLHLLMNLSWELFSAGDSALGGVYSNVFRAITIALVIILTVRWKRKKGDDMEVVRRRLWRG